MGRGHRRALVLALVAIAAAVAPHRLGADPVAAKGAEPAFLAALERVKALLAAGDAVGGRKTLDAALVAHADRDYVRAKRDDLEDLVRRLAFRAACPTPDPATLVKGTLKRYVPKTGDLEIRFSADRPHDLERVGDAGGLEFPARFAGPYRIVVKGASGAGRGPRGPSPGALEGRLRRVDSPGCRRPACRSTAAPCSGRRSPPRARSCSPACRSRARRTRTPSTWSWWAPASPAWRRRERSSRRGIA